MGRKRKKGNRFPSGKLAPANDGGNARVQAHRAPFLRHGDARAGDDLHCAIGQAHAAGLLEGMRVEGRVLMEHGKEWHRLHRATFGGIVATTRFERIGRETASLVLAPADARYVEWAAVVASLGARERRCLHEVCVDHGDSWDVPPFLARLVHAWKVRRGLADQGQSRMPGPRDHADLAALKSALLALAEGRRARGRCLECLVPAAGDARGIKLPA